jgi:para-nitrobenzyl esterase
VSFCIKISVRLCVLVLPALLLTACIFGSRMGEYPTVVVETGRLQGEDVNGVPVFKGVPYAAAPVGDLRWRAPQPVKPWKGIFDATEYGPHCAQFESEVLWFDLDKSSEDCLTLNIWSGADQRHEQLPVMVWIHGGGYSNGSGNIPRLNNPAFVGKDILLVTVNYRLGIFGFLTHPALAQSQPDAPIGNYGLQDVVASLEWVQRNIASFGGDPERVTVFGESAGAGIVNTLMVMPAAEGLFQRAISASASVGLAPDAYPDRTAGFLPPANKAGIDYVKRLTFEQNQGLDPESASPELAKALRDMPAEDLLSVWVETDRFTPVVDGVLLPDQVGVLAAAGKLHKIPYLNGGNSWEASLGREIGGGFSPEFAGKLVSADDKARLYPGLEGAALDDEIFGDLIVLSGSRYFANQMVAQGLPVYSYYLTYVADARRGDQPGAAHTDDIAFVMQSLDSESDLEYISVRDRQISSLMRTYWVQFAKKGNPNHNELPEWPVYADSNGPILEIGDKIIVRQELLNDRMQFHINRGVELLERVTK